MTFTGVEHLRSLNTSKYLAPLAAKPPTSCLERFRQIYLILIGGRRHTEGKFLQLSVSCCLYKQYWQMGSLEIKLLPTAARSLALDEFCKNMVNRRNMIEVSGLPTPSSLQVILAILQSRSRAVPRLSIAHALLHW